MSLLLLFRPHAATFVHEAAAALAATAVIGAASAITLAVAASPAASATLGAVAQLVLPGAFSGTLAATLAVAASAAAASWTEVAARGRNRSSKLI